jgi:hypothetical protein
VRLRTVRFLTVALSSSARPAFALSIAALLTFAIADPASAQAHNLAGRNELTVFGGASLAQPATNDPDRPIILGGIDLQIFPSPFLRSASLGGSAEFGVRWDRYVTEVVSVGGDFSVAPGHQYTERTGFGCPDGRLCILGPSPGASLVIPDVQVEERVVAYHNGAGVSVDLARGALRPSVMAGIGGATYDGERVGDTHFAVRVGGALRADAGRLVARLEVIDILTPNHFVTGRSEHDVHVRVGVGVRW